MIDDHVENLLHRRGWIITPSMNEALRGCERLVPQRFGQMAGDRHTRKREAPSGTAFDLRHEEVIAAITS